MQLYKHVEATAKIQLLTVSKLSTYIIILLGPGFVSSNQEFLSYYLIKNMRNFRAHTTLVTKSILNMSNYALKRLMPPIFEPMDLYGYLKLLIY